MITSSNLDTESRMMMMRTLRLMFTSNYQIQEIWSSYSSSSWNQIKPEMIIRGGVSVLDTRSSCVQALRVGCQRRQYRFHEKNLKRFKVMVCCSLRVSPRSFNVKWFEMYAEVSSRFNSLLLLLPGLSLSLIAQFARTTLYTYWEFWKLTSRRYSERVYLGESQTDTCLTTWISFAGSM